MTAACRIGEHQSKLRARQRTGTLQKKKENYLHYATMPAILYHPTEHRCHTAWRRLPGANSACVYHTAYKHGRNACLPTATGRQTKCCIDVRGMAARAAYAPPCSTMPHLRASFAAGAHGSTRAA